MAKRKARKQAPVEEVLVPRKQIVNLEEDWKGVQIGRSIRYAFRMVTPFIGVNRKERRWWTRVGLPALKKNPPKERVERRDRGTVDQPEAGSVSVGPS